MWTMLGAPLDSSGASRGEERAPAALRSAGIARVFAATDLGDVTPPLRGTERDPDTGVLALDGLRESSRTLCGAVADRIGRGERPLVIGGDCTVLLGALAGVRAAVGRVGLWFVDGHADYFGGWSSPTGEAADMDLAILSGDGPPGLVDLADPPPLVPPGDIVLLGHRPAELSDGSVTELARVPAQLRRMTAEEISAAGAGQVGVRWERELAGRGAVWLHVDLDVLDETALPAVTYPQPRGLDWADYVALIRPMLASPALVGASIADFNPDLDPTGVHARHVAEAFSRALS